LYNNPSKYICRLNMSEKSTTENPNFSEKSCFCQEVLANIITSIPSSTLANHGACARAFILVNGHGSWTQESAAMYEWNSKYNWQKGRRGQASRAFSQTRPAETGGMRCKTGIEREYRIEVITSLAFQDKRDILFYFFSPFVVLSIPLILYRSWSILVNY